MKVDQIQQGLEQAFVTENHRIVFWYDADQSFTETLATLSLTDVTVLKMSQESVLATKLHLEMTDTQGKYLLYFPHAEPEPTKDWLLDIKLYSRSFYADRFSIIFNELGLTSFALKEHLQSREKFLGNRSRLQSLKKYVAANVNETGLDLAMTAVLLKAESPEWLSILFAMVHEAVQGQIGLTQNSPSIDELHKYGLTQTWLETLRTHIGYEASAEELRGESPFKLGPFLIRLLVSAFCESLGMVPDWASTLVFSQGAGQASARAILSRWKDSSKYASSFDVVSEWVEVSLNIKDKLRGFAVSQLADVLIFEAIEKELIVAIAQGIPNAHLTELNGFQTIIATRLDGHWASSASGHLKYRQYRAIYTALAAAIRLFALRTQYLDGFHFKSSAALYTAYEQDLYAFDQAYRHYFAASDQAQVDVLKHLNDEVESCYASWYIDKLAKNWGECLETEQLLQNWSVPDVSQQYNFFKDQVQPLLSDKSGRRVVVIISDALRFEAAQELCEQINDKYHSAAILSSQLGGLPSYTTLGMASLLPHKTLAYKDNVADDVFVDGQSTKGTESRSKILFPHKGVAFRAEDVKSWKKEEGRQQFNQYELVYVYHNVIDARGDSSSTESETFEAVAAAIEDLKELTKKIINNFNTSRVIITADHGFLFQKSRLAVADRTSLVEKPANILKDKKRYVIASSLPENKEVWKGNTKQTANTTSETEFWIPKGANRFHFVGGSRFVHGGAMPQEIVVPIITVKGLRGSKAENHTKHKVDVISIKSTLKMVTNVQKFVFLQTEVLDEQSLPNTISVAIYDGDQKVSSEEVATFDSASSNMDERQKELKLSLLGNQFDRNQDYFLIIKDKDLGAEIHRYKVTIDLAFTDDFF